MTDNEGRLEEAKSQNLFTNTQVLDASPLQLLNEEEGGPSGSKTPVKGLGIGFGDSEKEEKKVADDKLGDADSRNGDFMCRICFSDDSEKENPLISPCKCSGSMQYVHLNCLR